MNTAININQLNSWEDKTSSKTIEFSSGVYNAIVNIPGALLFIALSPIFIFIFIPLVNILLWRSQKGLEGLMVEFKLKYSKLSYEDSKTAHELLNQLCSRLETIISESNKISTSILMRGIHKKFINIFNLFTEMRDALSKTLFIEMNNAEPFSEKEKEAMRSLNDIWGSDDDGTYAKLTHHHLSKKIKPSAAV